MSDLILLRNRRECPRCRCKFVHAHNGPCHNCGIQLFVRPINFDAFEADGNSKEWWLFDREFGWQHRSHVMMGLNPLSREVPELVTERNTKTAEQRIEEIRAETKREIKDRTPRRNMVGYGKSITRI